MNKKILMVVDYQHDFVNPNGKLPVPNADRLFKNIQQRIDSIEYDTIIYTFDTHILDEYMGSDEQKLFPNIHCEFNTVGWNLFNIIPRNNIEFENQITNIDKPFDMLNIDTEFFFSKNIFDIWEGNPVFANWFKTTFNPDECQIDVVGVAYEFCVAQNIDGLVKNGFTNINLINDCVAPITVDGKEKAKETFANYGVKFI